jgi:tRNA threonylcarbamoyladenosine modification (KEOPS) complex  Pcc1 subunit
MRVHRATIRIELGKGARDYLGVIEKTLDYKRSSVKISEKKGVISIVVEANDAMALMSSLNSSLKQLRIVSGADSAISKLK